MNIFESVKSGVTAREAAEFYGISVGRNGMAVCPFHQDRNPSLKLDNRFHCFGCQADGDVIDFTARLFGLSNYEAAKKLADDFSIEYDIARGKTGKSKAKRKQKKPGSQGREKAQPSRKPEEIYREAEQKCFQIYSDYLHLLQSWKEEFAPQSPDEEWNPLFCEALEKETYVEYLLDTLLDGTLGDRMKLVCDRQEEVMKIERELERYAEGTAGRDSESVIQTD